jgi:methionine--tRNA ligase
MSRETAYITTPIYYVNDKPHIGHVYTTTICDVWARFMRFAGRDVFFLTGTDEHGQKVEKSARERGIEPQALADENSAVFRDLMKTFHFTNDHFIRTTDADHERQVQVLVQRLIDVDAVYLGEFEGWYDEGQEEYHTETKARELDYTSPVSGRPLVRATEENFYFRLSAFQERMEKHYADHPDFVRPEARRNEMLGRMRDGLQDVPISRTNFTWGIPIPGHEQHVTYVWIDALMNYATALGLAEPEGATYAERGRYWPATYHVIGKEILWFHSVIWPAILMALDMPQPACVYAHSFWISEGQKMSKSLGNFIDLGTIERYLGVYGRDMWRYYLATQGPLGATDADFAAHHYHETYHTDLVNTLGNSASRVTAMINKYFDGLIPSQSTEVIAEHDWTEIAKGTVELSVVAMERFDLAGSIGSALALVRKVDGFINRTEPFKLAKDETKREELGAILYQCAEAIRIASILLWAVMPERVETLWQALGVEYDTRHDDLRNVCAWGGLPSGSQVQKIALFPRVEEPEVVSPS